MSRKFKCFTAFFFYMPNIFFYICPYWHIFILCSILIEVNSRIFEVF